MKIYLAGKVPKGDEIGSIEDWRMNSASALSQIPGVEFLSPDDPTLDESQPFIVFGHDCYLIKECDAVVVNASAKLGVGTAQEMVIAKYFRKPVVSVLPKDTHHRRLNLPMHAGVVPDWIHPFIFSTSDIVVEDFREATAWLMHYIHAPQDQYIKGIEIIEDAIKAYRESKTRSE